MKNILIQLHDQSWTLEALHQACHIINREGGSITLLQLMAVSHPLWLGHNTDYAQFFYQHNRALNKYQSIAENYGISISLQLMQYVTRKEALIQAAEMFNIDIVLSKSQPGLFKHWHELQNAHLARELAQQQRHLWLLVGP